jgi:hypothetical protein
MKTTRILSALAAVTLMIAGCNLLSPVDNPRRSASEAVLTSFLTPGVPIEVTLRSTIPLNEFYPFRPLDAYALSGATVLIKANDTPYILTEDPARPGVYTDPTLIAESLVRYSVEVTGLPAPFGERHLTAHTTVPGPVTLSATLSPSQIAMGGDFDKLVFPRQLADPKAFGSTSAQNPFRLDFTASDSAAGYTIGAISQDTSGVGLLRKTVYEQYLDGDFAGPDMRQQTHKSGYVLLPDSLGGEIFWLLFAYQGWSDVVVIANDEAYGNYFTTVTQGAGTSGADADIGPSLNVTGGLGVFGSYTADTIAVFIEPEWLPSDFVTKD